MSDATPTLALVNASTGSIYTEWTRSVHPQPGTTPAFLRGTGGGFSYVGTGALASPGLTLRCTGVTPAGPGLGETFSTDPAQGQLRDDLGRLVAKVTDFPATFTPP